ncbi:MAG: hypothetical protein KGJ82_19715, partial [Nitrospirota bacterium]|nr:hypothetical protein [Nitrospirota bacterium]
DEGPVRECPSGPEPEQGFTARPNRCVQSDPIAMTRDLATEGGVHISILLVLLLYGAADRYHPVHATHLDNRRPARGTLPHRSQYHPAHTGCN